LKNRQGGCSCGAFDFKGRWTWPPAGRTRGPYANLNVGKEAVGWGAAGDCATESTHSDRDGAMRLAGRRHSIFEKKRERKTLIEEICSVERAEVRNRAETREELEM